MRGTNQEGSDQASFNLHVNTQHLRLCSHSNYNFKYYVQLLFTNATCLKYLFEITIL